MSSSTNESLSGIIVHGSPDNWETHALIAQLRFTSLSFQIDWKALPQASPSKSLPYVTVPDSHPPICIGGFEACRKYVNSLVNVDDSLSKEQLAVARMTEHYLRSQLAPANASSTKNVLDMFRDLLGEKTFMLASDRPSTLDALAYGWLWLLDQQQQKSSAESSTAVEWGTTLIAYRNRIRERYVADAMYGTEVLDRIPSLAKSEERKSDDADKKKADAEEKKKKEQEEMTEEKKAEKRRSRNWMIASVISLLGFLLITQSLPAEEEEEAEEE